MKKIIVTGGSGFIGSNLVNFLIKKKFYVINIDKLAYSANNIVHKNKDSKFYKFYRLDINNKKKLIDIIKRYKPKAIFNLAAETHVDRSIDGPKNFIDTNTFSTADPSFEYAPVPPADDTEPEQDPCPPGYVYDETLKQCVPDPNYQNPFIQEQPQGGSDDDFSDTNKIPSNATKENWIANANTIIPPGEEGAGKTGYEN